jgi:very-short-patch-repair endonuclease
LDHEDLQETVPPNSVTPESTATDALRGLRNRVTKALTDGSRNNPLVYFRESRATRFGCAPLGSELIRKLLAGEAVRRADFSRDCPELVARTVPDAPDSAVPTDNAKPAGAARKLVPPADPLGTRLQAIRAKARENEEERGLRTLFAAVGMVSWPALDGGRPPCAPLFLVPVAISDDPKARGELVVQRPDDGEAVLNRALLTVAPPAFSQAVAGLFDDGEIDDVAAAYATVENAARDLPDVSLVPKTALGIFNFSLMAMVDDLHEAGNALAEHIVIRALAGDPIARDTLAGAKDGAVDVATLDDIAPVHEPFVLDADPWQAKTVQTLLQYPESHATIDGPPGTGKSQTIANLIASLIAQGKTVLFVCEKRAALDVVKRRLSTAGLGHLLLDLHGAAITRQRVYAQLRTARAQMREAAVAASTEDAALVATRERLNAHVRFMHTPLAGCALSPYQLFSELAALPKMSVGLRLSREQLTSIDAASLAALESDVAEAARYPDVFLRAPDIPWSTSPVAPNGVPAAIDSVTLLGSYLSTLKRGAEAIGRPLLTVADLLDFIATLRAMRQALAVCGPGALELEPASRQLALETLSSPFGAVLEVFSKPRRVAMRAVREHLRETDRGRCAGALRTLVGLGEPWQRSARAVTAFASDIDVAAGGWATAFATAQAALGATLPTDLAALAAWLGRCGSDRDGAYRAARMREIERRLAEHHFGALLASFVSMPPAEWSKAVRYTYLQSHLEPVRPELARFDGRTHDDVVKAFRELEAALRRISRDRVCRAAGERYVAVSNAHRDQQTAVNVQLEKTRPRKSLRALYSEAPAAMLGLAPCVMASPLSISQFLPRATIFDAVVFDEGSQVTPESAITAILRGRRVMIAGDDRQLPPTDFFAASNDDDDEEIDDDIAVAGTESILAALRSFTKDLGLRVHYRSRDERLIAFSNKYLYNDQLITFPGSGRDGDALRFVLVDPTGADIDEETSRPEVARVVDLILEHAEKRPNESLGVIALGLPHARRIEASLAAARRERPDLDAFFTETGEEPFFIKNLERVQGDERTAIILTIGYGRTKTGSVSHNFGPINKAGGERRLNVAVTRAKSRLTLVSSFRKSDLNPSSLNSTGPRLLAAYLGYVESKGLDLGRDGADVSVPPNAFELDIQRALEARLQTGILPQYGVGQFRIDLAVQHPGEPGRFVLAVECDGASYHNSPTARMRDRLRQSVLESLGWRFARIWSTDWFNNRESELERVEAMYREALLASTAVVRPAEETTRASEEAPAVTPHSIPQRSGPSPVRPPYNSISDVSDGTLQNLLTWIASDGLLRTNAELLDEMVRELGFHRRGVRIVERLERVIGKSS